MLDTTGLEVVKAVSGTLLAAPKDPRDYDKWLTELALNGRFFVHQHLKGIARSLVMLGTEELIARLLEDASVKTIFINYFGFYTPLSIGRRNGSRVLFRLVELDANEPDALLYSSFVGYRDDDASKGQRRGYTSRQFFVAARDCEYDIGPSIAEEDAFMLEQRRAILKKIIEELNH